MRIFLIMSFLLVACGPEDKQTNNGGTIPTTNNGTASNNGTTAGTTGGQTTQSNNGATSGETTGGTTTQTGEERTITEIFQVAFSETGCVVGYCHGGAVDGLVISDPEKSIAAMVNVDSIRPSCGLTKLVVPGKPKESLLWMRVRPAALETGEPCVAKMPKGTDGLSEEKAKLIYDWIASGAKL